MLTVEDREYSTSQAGIWGPKDLWRISLWKLIQELVTPYRLSLPDETSYRKAKKIIWRKILDRNPEAKETAKAILDLVDEMRALNQNMKASGDPHSEEYTEAELTFNLDLRLLTQKMNEVNI